MNIHGRIGGFGVLAALVLILTVGFAVLSAAQAQAQTGPAQMTKSSDDFNGDDEFLKTSKADDAARISDPWEPWNRFWYEFNDKLYFYVMKPVAKGYKKVVPERPREWVQNFFHNLLFPVRFVNCMFQGKLFEAGTEVSRFIANTAFGFGGLSRFAYDLKPVRPMGSTEEDFGQTLGAWGVGNGIYLVWPFLGPSTVRDTVGFIGDSALDPVSYLNPWYYALGSKAYDRINDTSFRIGEYETLKDGSLEPYVAMRDAYVRFRMKAVKE
jgi:phospholipid-binding lipoprotein MlaA